MIVGNCGSDASLNVDVSGWIVDDNDGNFDTGTCTVTGTTPGHYRLGYNNVWQNVQVGSRIVVYNAATNCYALPDTFTIDTVNNIYWVPVPATVADSGYVLERYYGAENGSDTTAYCSDTGTTIYTPAYGWEQTIALAPQDAIQVRCPGCSAAYPGAPVFYHGIGYAPDSFYCYAAIAASANSLGGPVEYNPDANQKYVFTGATAADLGNPAEWTAYSADAAGTPPATLGYVDSALYYGIFLHNFGLPCCSYGDGGGGSRRTSPTANNQKPVPAAGIMVFPNPAHTLLYFEYPQSASTNIRLTDITGRVVASETVQQSSMTNINVSALAPGVYLYQVTTDTQSQQGKIVIQ